MKKTLVLLSLLILIAAFAAGAQGTSMPKSGDIGIGASVSSSSNTALLFYHLTDSFMLAPEVGSYYYDYADTFGGKTTDYSGTWFDVGLGIYYQVLHFDFLSVQVGPRGGFSYEPYRAHFSPGANVDSYTQTNWWVNLDLRVLAMITKNLGVFTRFGVYYYSYDNNDTTASYDSLNSGFGFQTVSLGVAYYFK